MMDINFINCKSRFLKSGIMKNIIVSSFVVILTSFFSYSQEDDAAVLGALFQKLNDKPVEIKLSHYPDKKYGTEIDWVDNESEAIEKAIDGGKMLMVMHISGNFEDPDKT